jgi:hypothetical protein
MTISSPQRTNIELNRVYRRAEFAQRPEAWSSPLPSLEIVGEGDIIIYGSNLPSYVDTEIYLPPIGDTLGEIESKMTRITPENTFLKAGFHDACMCSIWIAFVWVEGSSIEPPILRDACLLDWELDYRRKIANGYVI